MRPLIFIAVGYITGIIWGLYLKLSIVPILFIFGIIVLLYKLKIIKLNNRLNNKILISISLFLIFALISNIKITKVENNHNNLYKGLEDVEIIGTIISDKKETNYKASYTVKVESINEEIKFKETNLLIYTSKNVNLSYGDKVILNGTYEQAKGATNYKAFDYREYLKEKNIYGILNVDKVQIIKKDNLNCILVLFHNIKNKVKLNLKKVLR